MARDILVYHGFPPETSGDLADFRDRIEDAIPALNLIQTDDRSDVMESIPDADILIEHRMPMELLEGGSSLEWIQSLSAGVNRYDLETLEERDVMLTTVSGVHAQPVAEHVLGYMLYFERDLGRINHQQRSANWRRFAPGELKNRTVGILGVGKIGGRVAEFASAVGMRVVGTKRDTSTYNETVDEIYTQNDVHTVLGASDYVVLALPLTEQTEELIGSAEFDSMKDDAVLINIARGEIIDHQQLVLTLREGYLGGAALDVTNPEPLPQGSPLWDMENVIVSPHMAGGSPAFPRRCADIFVHNFEQYSNGTYDGMRNRVL